MVRGESAAVIARALGCSEATAKRRMAELRKGVPAARAERRAAAPREHAPAARAALPDPDAIDGEGTTLAQIDEWLKLAKEEIAAASGKDGAQGESDTLAKMVRLAAALLALKVKATPPAPADPNANPDFIAAAERVRKRWHDLLDKVTP